jgi:hypothetical protein
MVTRNFASKTLGRTFDEIHFVGALQVLKGDGPEPRGAHGAAARMATPGADLTGIAKAEGGLTVAEILAGKESGAVDRDEAIVEDASVTVESAAPQVRVVSSEASAAPEIRATVPAPAVFQLRAGPELAYGPRRAFKRASPPAVVGRESGRGHRESTP